MLNIYHSFKLAFGDSITLIILAKNVVLYSLNSKFNFGVYKGLTIQDVHQGTLLIEREFLEQYMLFLLETEQVLKYYNFSGQAISVLDVIADIRIRNNYLETLCIVPERSKHSGESTRYELCTFFGLTEYLGRYVNCANSVEGKIWGLTSLEQFANSIKYQKRLTAAPSYICWCIENIDDFVLGSTVFDELEKLKICTYDEFQFLEVPSMGYLFDLKLNIQEYKYSQRIKYINSEKVQ